MTMRLRITIPFEQDDYDSVYEVLEQAFDKIGQDRDWLINATAEGVDGEISDDEDSPYSAYVYDPAQPNSDATCFDIIRDARRTGAIRSVEGYGNEGKTVAIVVGAYGEKAEAIAKFVEGL